MSQELTISHKPTLGDLKRWPSLYRLFLFSIAIIWIGTMVVSFWLKSDSVIALQSPSLSHWFGTDSLGRDLFFKTMRALSFSMLIGSAALVSALAIGFTLAGAVSLASNRLALVFESIVDVAMLVPNLLWLLLLWFLLEPWAVSEELKLVIVFGLVGWSTFYRYTSLWIQSEMSQQYTEAAAAIGASRAQILYKHVFINLRAKIFALAILQWPQFLLFEAILSFLGFGLKPPAVSLGLLLQEGWKVILVAPHVMLAPSATLVAFIFLTNQLLVSKR